MTVNPCANFFYKLLVVLELTGETSIEYVSKRNYCGCMIQTFISTSEKLNVILFCLQPHKVTTLSFAEYKVDFYIHLCIVNESWKLKRHF